MNRIIQYIICLILSACNPATELFIAEVAEDIDREIIKNEIKNQANK